MNFKTPQRQKLTFPARFRTLLLTGFGLAIGFTAVAFGQGFGRPDGSVPVPMDWSSKHVVFTAGFTAEQAAKMWNEPRAYAEWLLHGNEPPGSGLERRHWRRPWRRRLRPGIARDWAVSLGAGGVAEGMFPAKYSFDVTATPSCTADFVVFPVNASTGNTRANVTGTFSAEPAAGNTTAITITPSSGTAVTLTLTSSATTNTGLDFEVNSTVATNATNLAAAINRNLSSTALDRIVAVASGATVTVYALTPGTRVTLTDANTLTNFSWGTVTAGTNGSQANIVGLNHLYSGSGTSLCNLTNPEFIFSYASGVGPVATSPGLSVGGTEVSYVENDPNIGAILHVLTFASGSTEYGASTTCASNNNGGATLPTCATNPVIPGSTSGSTATDFMLPLGLVAANAATGVAGAADSFSSPFTDYANDTTYVGDNNGYLYAITPTFKGTPAYAGGNFPVHVNATTPASATPTAVTATTTVVTVTVANSLSIGELVTIAGVTANTGNGCTAGDVAAINGVQIPASASATQITFAATIPSATTGCTLTGATVTQGSNFLAAPVVDVGGTGNILVGDSSSNLYELTPAGATAATALALGVNGATNQGAINGGIRDAVVLDSTNGVGYVITACNPNTTGEQDTGTEGNTALVQFTFAGSTLTADVYAGLDTGANQSCSVAGYPNYAPAPDERYYALGIGSATAANNGEIIGATSGTGGQQLKELQFVSSAMQATPLNSDKPQVGTDPSPLSPLTEFYNPLGVFTVTGVTASTTVVTVTANNTFAVNDLVTLSGVASNANCAAADFPAITASMQTVASATATNFTFNANTTLTPTTGTGCTVTGATATGGPDYMFVGVVQNPTELYSFLLPNSLLVASGDAPTIQAKNTTDVAGGTSGIIVDNDSTAGQASSIYFGTLATSNSICGTTAAYCAVKLTQSALQ
ncbi:MAG TPA: hypothetical protein VK706_02705 [Candidatus Sulfotelmatobacter sp.]|jgi:hypothetical protein|nr:hypothetical protein [Candidatus Sulfotelmatobacter sp.]